MIFGAVTREAIDLARILFTAHFSIGRNIGAAERQTCKDLQSGNSPARTEATRQRQNSCSQPNEPDQVRWDGF